MNLTPKDLKKILQVAKKIQKEEGLPKEDCLDEAYRRLGLGHKK